MNRNKKGPQQSRPDKLKTVYLFESKLMKKETQKNLFLIVSGEWFEMIEADIKKTEYRELTVQCFMQGRN